VLAVRISFPQARGGAPLALRLSPRFILLMHIRCLSRFPAVLSLAALSLIVSCGGDGPTEANGNSIQYMGNPLPFASIHDGTHVLTAYGPTGAIVRQERRTVWWEVARRTRAGAFSFSAYDVDGTGSGGGETYSGTLGNGTLRITYVDSDPTHEMFLDFMRDMARNEFVDGGIVRCVESEVVGKEITGTVTNTTVTAKADFTANCPPINRPTATRQYRFTFEYRATRVPFSPNR
jgi:hypothetical protein